MKNIDYYRNWVLKTIKDMSAEEFVPFIQAFLAGYDEDESVLTCVDVCGHKPNEFCENCKEKVDTFMASERKEDQTC